MAMSKLSWDRSAGSQATLGDASLNGLQVKEIPTRSARSLAAVEKAKAKVNEKLRNAGLSFTVPSGRVVRSTGPNWYQVVLDIHVSHK